MRKALVVTTLALASAVAWAFPWDIDMVDGPMYKAYEWEMMPLPEGTVSRNMYREPNNRFSPEGMALSNPLTIDENTIATGERMFTIYCTTCHGEEGKGGAPVADNDPAKNLKRYPIPPPMLSGPGAVTPLRSDGYLFLTIRDGGAIMPSYGYGMDDEETWALVAYIRTLEGAQQPPPQPTEQP